MVNLIKRVSPESKSERGKRGYYKESKVSGEVKKKLSAGIDLGY